MSKNLTLLVLLLVSVLGSVIILISTRWGVGTSPDSVTYIVGARNIALGHGFSKLLPGGDYLPITQLAPFYSVLLSLIGFAGIDPISAARWVNSLLFGAVIFFVGFLLYALLGNDDRRSGWIALAGSLLVLSSIVMTEVYTMAWSEGLFLFLGLLGITLLGVNLDHPRFIYLVLSAITFGLAFLTRYTGIAFIATGFMGLLLFDQRHRGKRIFDLLLFGFIGISPMLIWLMINSSSGVSVTNREFAVHLINVDQVRQLLTTLASWLLIPETYSGFLKLFAVLMILIGLAYYVYLRVKIGNLTSQQGASGDPYRTPGVIRLIIMFLIIYPILLGVSISFFDANTPLNNRILSPIYLFGLILILYVTGKILQIKKDSKAFLFVSAFLGLAVISGYLLNSTPYITNSYRYGIGYYSLNWRTSDLIKKLNGMPAGTNIYTNVPEAIFLYTTMPAFSFPKKFESIVQRPNANYQAELDEMKKNIEDDNNSLLVIFNTVNRPNLPSQQELVDFLSLTEISQGSDGTIYKAAKAN